MKLSLFCFFLVHSFVTLHSQNFPLRAFTGPERYDIAVAGGEEITLSLEGVAEGDVYELEIRPDGGVFPFTYGAIPENGREERPGYLVGVAGKEMPRICLTQLDATAQKLEVSLRKNRESLETRVKSNAAGFMIRNENNSDSLLNVMFRNESCFEYDTVRLISGRRTVERPFNSGNFEEVSQSGIFTGGTDVIGMEAGVILSTGFVTDANKPNSAGSAATGLFPNNTYRDVDANSLAGPGNEAGDVVVLEFKFTPTTDELRFNYIFFSEEYCDGVGANSFNDAFAFYLTGPGILPNGRANIALLPDNSTVNVDNVNPDRNAAFYVDNTPPGKGSGSCMVATTPDPDVLSNFVYDGFTQKLTAQASVIPCNEYRLKLVALDVDVFEGSYFLDSGVLLEAGSFIAGLISDPEPSVAGVPGTLTPTESCDSASLTFSRLFSTPADVALPLEVNYNLITTAGIPLATPGVDFEWPEPPFTIPAGDMSATLNIPILSDGVLEGDEAIIIRYDGTCNCDANRDTFYVRDLTPLDFELGPDQVACAGQTIDFTPTVAGGNGSYTYLWSDGSTQPTYTTAADGNANTIELTVMDGCGQMATRSVNIDPPAVAASVGGTYSLCNVTSVDVPVTLSGGTTYTVTVQIDSADILTESTYAETGDFNITLDHPAIITLVSVVDENGCGGATGGTAEVLGGGVEFSDFVTQPTCPGQNGAILLNLAGDEADYSVVWDDGPTGLTRNNIPPGDYTVEVALLSAPACGVRRSFTIGRPPLALQIALTTPPDCPFELDTLSALVTGGTPPYIYRWNDVPSPDSTFEYETVPGVTQYRLSVTDACDVTVTDAVTQTFEEVQATIGGVFGVCNPPFTADVPLTLSGSSTYQVYLSENGTSRRLDLTGSTTIQYTEATEIVLDSVFGSNGCPGTAIGSARVVDSDFTLDTKIIPPTCRGGNDGSVNISVNENSDDYDFVWSDPSLVGNFPQNVSFGTYEVTITDKSPAACQIVTTVAVTEPGALNLSITQPTIGCAGEEIVLVPTVAGGILPYTYDWNAGTGTDSIFATSAAAGTTVYTLVVTDGCGAEVTESVTFDLPDIRAGISGNFSVCNVDEVAVPFTLSGSTNYTVSLNENGVLRTFLASQDTTLIYRAATDLELVSVASANDCPGTIDGAFATVTDAGWTVSTVVTDVACAGGAAGAVEVTVSGGGGTNFLYTWDRPGVTGPNPRNLPAGTYQLRVTEDSPAACSFDTTISILEPATSIVFLSDEQRTQTCERLAYAEAAYSGGTGDLSYKWSNGTTGQVLGEVPAGTYELSVTDENGCLLTQTFALRDNRTAVLAGISASAAELSCTRSSLELSAQQNTRPVTYTWLDSTRTEIGNSRIQTVSRAGKYYVEVFDAASGCLATDSVNVSSSEDLVEFSLPSSFLVTCAQTSVDIIVTLDQFYGDVTYTWTLDGAPLPGNAPSQLGVTTPGTYRVGIRRSDNGCTTFGETTVAVDQDPPIASLRNEQVSLNCRMPEVELAVIAPAGSGTTWSTTDGNLTGDVNGALTTADRPGNYLATVTDSVSGCTTVLTARAVPDGATLVANAGTDRILLCDGIGTLLEATYQPNLPATETRWYRPDGEVLSEGPNGFARTAGAYALEVIHPVSGCSSFDTVVVRSEAPTGVTYSIQQPPCPEVGGRLTVRSVEGVNGPFAFSSPTATTDPLGEGLKDLTEGNHTLIVTDALGCTYEETFQVFAAGNFLGSTEEITVRLGESAELGVTTNRPEEEMGTFFWSNLPDSSACNDCPNPVVRPRESFIAALTVTDINGCVLSLQQDVFVDERDIVYMPTAFSPANLDGANDTYTVYGRGEFVPNVNFLRIFNRWGALVFEQTDFTVNDEGSGWNGLFNGQLAPAGTYIYSVSVTLDDESVEVLKGTMTLVR